MKLDKIVYIGLGVLIAISALLVISLASNITDNPLDPKMNSWINTNVVWAYILFIMATAAMISFGLLHIFSDRKSMKNGLFVFAFFAVVLLLSYVFADSAIPQFHGVEKFVDDGTLTPTSSKWIETGLNTAYIMFFLAVGSMALAPLLRFRK